MIRPNFFCDIDTLTYLHHLFDAEYGKTHPTVDISVDIIDEPYWLLFSSDEESWRLKITRRCEVFSHDEDSAVEIGHLAFSKTTGQGYGNAVDEVPRENLGFLYVSCKNLSIYAQENNWDTEFGGLDPDKAGVLLAVENDELTHKVVSGRARPDMMCAELFGGSSMGRPYTDEYAANFALEMMPFAEKLEAAENGDEKAMDAVAQTYLNGDEDEDIEADPEKGVYWFTKLAELGDAMAQYNLGLHYAKGHGVQRDFEKAAYWMQQAADNGDEDAPALLEKYTKAAEAIKKIDSGDAQAQADLAGVLMALAGSLYQAGTTEDDFTQAFELAQKSAAQNNGDGLWVLALAYEHGRGTEQDVEKAIECYRKGAELGHAPSQHSLGCYYLRGDVLEQDEEKGFELCMKSAEQGYGLAMATVGRCYQFGLGVMGNMKTAVEWYEKALEVIDDPELERKTAMFKMIGENDEHWGEDYPGTDEDDFDDDEDGSDLPDGYMVALEAFEEAEEYENELADEGVLPDAPRPGNGVMDLSPEGFPRIAQKAEEGDERAIAILEKMKAANEMK